MDKLEKFKKLFIKTLNQSRRFGLFGINDEDYEQYDKDKQELIKMYSDEVNKNNVEIDDGSGINFGTMWINVK